MTFLHSLIRFVPDPVRAEFVNIGAIAGSDDASDWALRLIENPSRAHKLDDAVVYPAVLGVVDRLRRDIELFEREVEAPSLRGGSAVSEAWLHALHAQHRNIIQFSTPAPLIADSADDALDRVFNRLVVDPERSLRGPNRRSAVAALRAAYKTVGLKRNADLYEGATLHSGPYEGRIDFAVANGKVVQLAQAWSLNVQDQGALVDQVRSFGWTMRALQADGGELVTREKTLSIPRDVGLSVVYVADGGLATNRTRAEADAVFQSIHATAVDVANASAIATDGLQRLQHSLLDH